LKLLKRRGSTKKFRRSLKKTFLIVEEDLPDRETTEKSHRQQVDRAVMILFLRRMSRMMAADFKLFKVFLDVSSTLMDVLRYNAGASSANSARPKYHL
jgi:hypothetical protein